MRVRKPTVLGLDLSLPFSLYAWRLRTRAAQELLAAVGIAVGVALVFGVLVANTSIDGSASGLVHQLIGSAQLQLISRSQEGFSQQVARRVEALPGVQASSPLLREDAVITGAHGSEPIQLIGLTVRQLALNPEAARNLGTSATNLISNGIGLPSSVAEAAGANANTVVSLTANGTIQRVSVDAVLGNQTVGAVAGSPVAIALLGTAQRLTGEPGRVTTVLVKAKPGERVLVARELRALAGGRADVTPADNDLRLFETAAKPNKQSTTLFAAIAGMVGFLLALNAMLLTTPERRRLVAELRTYGYDPPQIVAILAVQALILGIAGSVVGIAFGYVLSHTLFAQVPGYLAIAFPIGTDKIVTAKVVVIAFGSGVLAALLASTRPLFDLRPRLPMVLGRMILSGSRLMRALFAATVAAVVLGGCGGARKQAVPAVLGRGQTAAGAIFVATLQPTSKCPLEVRIVEAGIANMLCYSIFEQPVRPKIECLPGGRLVLHWRVAPTALGVQLTLSDDRRITSSVMRVASGLGGPAGLYYQAVRGPTPIPVEVREIGGTSRTEGVKRVVECTTPLVKQVGRDERPFARIPTPGGSLAISNRVDRILGKDHQGLTAVLKGPRPAIVGSGALRLLPPLRWEARRICSGPTPFTVLYGIVEGQRYRVFAQFNRRLYALRTKSIPGWVGLRGSLVYGVWPDVPRELIVRTASGKVVETMEVGTLIAQTPCL